MCFLHAGYRELELSHQGRPKWSVTYMQVFYSMFFYTLFYRWNNKQSPTTCLPAKSSSGWIFLKTAYRIQSFSYLQYFHLVPGVLGGFRLGCPGVDGKTCRSPTVDENIKVYLISSERTGNLWVDHPEVVARIARRCGTNERCVNG